MRRFSAWGYLLFTLWGVLLALVVDGWWTAALALFQLGFGLLWSREGLRPLRRLPFWLFIGGAVALGPFLSREIGGTGETLGGVSLGWPGLLRGLEMAGRALTLTLAFSVGLSALSLSDLMALFDRLHIRGLGFALGVAMNLLTTLQEMATLTLDTIRLRGGLRRPVVAIRLFLVTLVSNTLRYGDQVVDAAAIRAFDPNGVGPAEAYAATRWRRADAELSVVLLAAAVLLLTFG